MEFQQKKRKILLINNNDIGITTFRSHLVKVAREKYEIKLVAIDCEKNNKKEIKCLKLRHKKSVFLGSLNIYLIIKLKKIIKLYKPDLLISFTHKANIITTIANLRTKNSHIIVINGLGYLYNNNNIISKSIRMTYKLTSSSKMFVFQNDLIKKYFSSFTYLNSKVIYGSGVDLNKFNYSDPNFNSKIRFLFVGRLIPKKGIEIFIDAAKELLKMKNDVIFEIVGYGKSNYEKKIKKIIKDYSQIQFLGRIKEGIERCYKRSDALIFSSDYGEGIPNVILESFSTGRPAIVFDNDINKKLVTDKIEGLICDKLNYLALAVTMKNFCDMSRNHRIKMGRNARKKVELYFSKELISNQYLNFIDESFNYWNKS